MGEPNYRTIVEQIRTHLGLKGIHEVGTLCRHTDERVEEYGRPDKTAKHVDVTITFRVNKPEGTT